MRVLPAEDTAAKGAGQAPIPGLIVAVLVQVGIGFRPANRLPSWKP